MTDFEVRWFFRLRNLRRQIATVMARHRVWL
jgi:hypothetical protein